MNLTIPELSLVVLIGASGSGKSTFARQHFLPSEVISSDSCRALVSDDENALDATGDAFDVLHYIVGKRLARGRLTVIDATSVKREDRKPLVELARQFHVLPVAIVLDIPEQVCQERNQRRPERSFGPHVVRNHRQHLRKSLSGLRREGFRHVFVLSSPEEVAAVRIERQPLWNNRKGEHGPFDIIGDLHGCADELETLLHRLGYEPVAVAGKDSPWEAPLYSHPEGRKVVFLGDLVDRGPRILDTVRIVRAMTEAGNALCVPGNHDMKLLRKLRGKDVQITHGLDTTLTEIEALPETVRQSFVQEFATFLDGLVSHYVLDDGKLVVAHAGLREEMQGRGSGAVRAFALYGETTGETDEFGLPVRANWAAEYRGKAMVVYGHTPVAEPQWLNRTINIDTGCVFGGSLSALRYPEREVVSVPARHTYYAPARQFLVEPVPALTAQQAHDELLDITDVSGKRFISTRLQQTVTIREENSAAALEIMSRFAVNPKWLIYLPPTMSPTETSAYPDLLEHPAESFAYYRREGVPRVICEEKHMGSRAVLVLARDAEAARQYFGVSSGETGVCYTRTGRPFFPQPLQGALIDRVRVAVDRSGLWEELHTGWIALDCELMPWSAKAQDLLQNQYAPVAAAGEAMLQRAAELVAATRQRGLEVAALETRLSQRGSALAAYRAAYGQYCWPAHSIADLRLAPFHILASEGAVHVNQTHRWHMEHIARLCVADPDLFHPTRYLEVNVTDPESEAAAVRWWVELTSAGGEGMVVKPLDFIARGRRGLVQPALKCRGPEYLRIIYGPEYTLPENLSRLRGRNVGAKRSLALREFALGIEALERFVRQEPLRRVHESVFGVLALESEPVDPRL